MQKNNHFTFSHAMRTDVGRVRDINEDSCVCVPNSGVWVVSDGMGGHSAGDFASQTITTAMQTLGIPVSLDDLKVRFIERLSEANARIIHHAQTLGGGTVGATVAAVLTHGGQFACVWSGDSRVYRCRDGATKQISRDHTEVQALLDAGTITQDQAINWPRKNVITRAIGVSDVPQCDVVEATLRDLDHFLVCSDGLTEYFEAPEISDVLANASGRTLDEMCDHFVDQAVARGGKDNISVIIFSCQALPPEPLTTVWDFPEFEGTL